ncbi:hypothetical protein [Rhizosphaericola mali]|uniref:hypothetical protein n=1 Tax=Rhizosphaericola mali TaxID=2545455 RepID=UPI00177AC722|nr:hypothetical protein [Rhizosphaericola mali]
MVIKYNKAFVEKLERILVESDYFIRYERGNFQSGWCLLEMKRIVVLNKFLNEEARVNTLMELIPQLNIEFDKLTIDSQKLYTFLLEEVKNVERTVDEEKGNNQNILPLY